MNIKIERISEADFEQLLVLFREFAEFEKLPHKMTNTLDRMREEADLLNGFTAKDEQGAILGYVTFFYAYYTWLGKSLYMDDLYIRPPYRGRGLGSKLIKEVVSFAKTSKCNKLRWQVSNWNEPAIGFYKSLGAEIDGVENNCDLILS